METNNNSKQITVVMPAYNSAGMVGETVKAALSIRGVNSVIVVDDGSVDRTKEEADGAGATVICHPRNRGKGAALQTGIDAALNSGAGIVLLLDSDLGSCVTEGLKLIEPVISGQVDMTIARFMGSGGGGFGIVKRFSQRILKIFTGQHFDSPLSGQRALSAELARKVKMRSGWGAEVGLTIDAHKAGFRVMEVPVQMSQTGTGRNLRGFKHRGRQLLGILKTTVQIMLGR